MSKDSVPLSTQPLTTLRHHPQPLWQLRTKPRGGRGGGQPHAIPPVHPASSTPPVHLTLPSRAGGQAVSTPEVKGELGLRPGEGRGWHGSVQDHPRQVGTPVFHRHRAWWGWLLPEAHTRRWVIKAISHLPSGELQAGAHSWHGSGLSAGRGSGQDIWAGAGGLQIRACPPFWL